MPKTELICYPVNDMPEKWLYVHETYVADVISEEDTSEGSERAHQVGLLLLRLVAMMLRSPYVINHDLPSMSQEPRHDPR